MAQHESWVERQIREATERGEFSGLRGSGKPLDLGDPDDPDWWVKRVMKREGLDASAAMPPVMQLRAEHASFPESLLDVGTADGVREVLRDYNSRVVADRLRPVIGRGMPVIAPRLQPQEIEDLVLRWEALRRERAEAQRAAAPAPAAPEPAPGRLSRLAARLAGRLRRRRS